MGLFSRSSEEVKPATESGDKLMIRSKILNDILYGALYYCFYRSGGEGDRRDREYFTRQSICSCSLKYVYNVQCVV